jgi:hypothetical protein
MTLSLFNTIDLQKFAILTNEKIIQSIKYLNKFLTSMVVFMILLLPLLAIIGLASTTQKLESDVGLRHKNVSLEQVNFFNKIKKAILDAPEASAFSLNPLDGLGEILGSAIKAVTDPVFNIVLTLIKGIILPLVDAIIKPILSILNGILDVITSVLRAVESLASNLSGTRVGIGFSIYRDLEGVGNGSSNFQSSTAFTKELLGIATRDGTQNIFESDFPKKDEAQKLVADSVAWGDFMSVQKSLQSNLVGDIVTAALFVGNGINFEKMNENITDIIIGKKCESSNVIFSKTPIFKSFGGVVNTCDAENRGIIAQKLQARQQQVFANTLIKSQQFESLLPADCKYGQYFDIAPGSDIKYDENNPGDLGIKISTFGASLKVKTITAAECQNLKTGQGEQTKSITEIFSASNVTAAFGAGAPISVALGTLSTQLGKSLFSSLQDKFKKAMDIIKSIGSQIGSGAGLYGALNTVISIKSKINSRLETLNQEYQDFRDSKISTLATPTVAALKEDQ